MDERSRHSDDAPPSQGLDLLPEQPLVPGCAKNKEKVLMVLQGARLNSASCQDIRANL